MPRRGCLERRLTVNVAQRSERLVVAQEVVGPNPIVHPSVRCLLYAGVPTCIFCLPESWFQVGPGHGGYLVQARRVSGPNPVPGTC